jgi:hypothetical protein
MCLFSKVLDYHASVGCCSYKSSIRPHARMGHQRYVNIVISVCSSIKETNLAATSLCDERVSFALQSIIISLDSPSAGVPNKTTFPPKPLSIKTPAVANAAPTDATAIKLCPQACPSPVRASVP